MKKLLAWYCEDSDPGVHGGIDWLLRQKWKECNKTEELDSIDEHKIKEIKELDSIAWRRRRKWKECDQTKELDRRDPEPAGKPPNGPSWWYINCQKQTFAVVPGPVEFCMGSPEYETDRDDDENQHHKRIDRSFAIATKEVTVAQYLRFLEDNRKSP